MSQDLLDDYTITSAEETMLGANQWALDSDRLVWDQSLSSSSVKQQKDETVITLDPMDIRTFVITIEKK